MLAVLFLLCRLPCRLRRSARRSVHAGPGSLHGEAAPVQASGLPSRHRKDAVATRVSEGPRDRPGRDHSSADASLRSHRSSCHSACRVRSVANQIGTVLVINGLRTHTEEPSPLCEECTCGLKATASLKERSTSTLAAAGLNPATRDLRDVHNLADLALRLQSGKLLRMPHDFCTCPTLSQLASTLVASAWSASVLAKCATAPAYANSKCE